MPVVAHRQLTLDTARARRSHDIAAAMTATGRRVRLAATAIVLAVLVAGSLWGADHDFPFGPFRMYATTGRPTGAVRTAALVGIRDGRRVALQPELVGLRRAELEGQYPRFRQDPRLLAAVARSYDRHGVHLDELRLVERVRQIVDRRRVPGSHGRVLAVWRRER